MVCLNGYKSEEDDENSEFCSSHPKNQLGLTLYSPARREELLRKVIKKLMAKQRVSINGITKWKEIDETPKRVAPVVEEARVVPLRQAIGEVLRDVRQRQGRTLREVSQRARVSLGYLSEVERGQKEASSELLAWICQALDIPMSQMLREVADRMAVAEGVQIPDTVPAELSERYKNDYYVSL